MKTGKTGENRPGGSILDILVIASLCLIFATAAGAQEEKGIVHGTIMLENGTAVDQARVEVIGTGLEALTDETGAYVMGDIPPGEYILRVTKPGLDEEIVSAAVRAGESYLVDLTMKIENRIEGVSPEERHAAYEEMVITGSRTREKLVDAPVAIETASEQDISIHGGSAYLEAIASLKGIDYADAGMVEKRISARGFNNQFNSRMITMVDGRLATLPGNGLPQAGLLPTSSLDMKSIEVVVGPASALYGPNAHTGVINVLTKTPWDQAGVSAALRGGALTDYNLAPGESLEHYLLDGSVRVAGTISEDFGYKLNAQYLQGRDFAPRRDQKSHEYGNPGQPLVFEADLVEGYDILSAKAEGAVYYRFLDWTAKAGYGYSHNTGFSMTNAGRNHIRAWEVDYQVIQLNHPNWYVQFTRTHADAGKTYQLDALAKQAQEMGGAPEDPSELDDLRDQLKFTDLSDLLDGEVQYRNEFFGIKLTTGLQTRYFMPDSGGTYLADADGQDLNALEMGGYVQLDYNLLDDLRLVGATRVDGHSNYSPQVSPKAAVVYQIAPQNNIRIGYNHAIKSPTILENYLFINQILLGNKNGFVIKDASGTVTSEIDPLQPEVVDAMEIGYKGVFADSVFVDAVAYHSWYQNFISPLTQRSNPAEGTFAYHPDGRMVAEGSGMDGMLFTYANFGEARVLGFDLGVNYYLNRFLTLGTSLSYIKLLDFTAGGGQTELLLNVPEVKLKGTITLRDLGLENYFVKLSGRFQSAYEFASGHWTSEKYYDDGQIPARFVADLALGYRFDQGFTVSANIKNLFNNKDVDILGAPISGTFAYLQVAYDYDGLEY